MGYVIASMEEVIAGRVEPYVASLRAVKERGRARASTTIANFYLRGITPEEGQYTEVPIRPAQFSETTDFTKTPANTFRRELVSPDIPCWVDLLTADLSATGELKTEYVMGIVGIGIYDSVKRITEIEFQSGDYTFPVINIEHALTTVGPIAIILDMTESNVDKFIWDKDRAFKLRGYVESTGYQRLAPLGVIYLPKNDAIKETFPAPAT